MGFFLVSHRLVVHRTQVVAIEAEKMIIEDGSVPAHEHKKMLAISPLPKNETAPLTSNRES